MKNKNIGFDIDDVVFDFVGNYLKFFNIKHDTSLKKEDISDWEMIKFLGIDKEEYKKDIFDFKLYSNGIIDESFFKIYNLLKENNNTISFISSRFNFDEFGYYTLNETINWLKKYGINENVFITNNKHDIIVKNNIDYFIDDGLHNLLNIFNGDNKLYGNSKTNLILLEKPWNGKNEIERLKKEKLIENQNFLKEIKIIKNISQIIL